AAIGNILDGHPAIAIRHAKVRGVHRKDRAAHFRVNVAEEKADAGTIEMNHLAGPRLVKSEIKSLAVKKRENIVQEGIFVGKLHRRSHLNDHHMWIETLVDLRDLRRRMAGRGCGSGASSR